MSRMLAPWRDRADGPRPPAFLPPVSIREAVQVSVTLVRLYPRLRSAFDRDLGRAPGERATRVRPIVATAKTRRRLLIGAYLGYSTSRYLLRGEARPSRDDHLLHAEIYGWWGITVIAIDGWVDAAQLDGREAATFIERCLGLILRKPVALDVPTRVGSDLTARPGAAPAASAGGRLRAEALCESLASRIGRLAGSRRGRLGAASAFPSCLAEFEARATALWNGELASLEQSIVDDAHDWAWYYRNVLDQKTLNFALAPIALYRATPLAGRRYDRLERAFLRLNAGFVHWQLVDDVADLPADTERGLVTAPGYLLISQGQLADRLAGIAADAADSDGRQRDVCRAVRASCLLAEGLWPGPAHNHRRDLAADRAPPGAGRPVQGGPSSCAVRALANVPAELGRSLPDLCDRRRRQRAAYVGALRSGDADAAVRVVLESGVAYRILATIEDRERARRVRAELAEAAGGGLLPVLRAFHWLMGRAYRRASRLAATRPRSPEPGDGAPT